MQGGTWSEDALHWNKTANRLVREGSLQEAHRAYLNALEIDPNFIEAWGSLASFFLHVGEIEKAEECFEQAFDINPDYAYTWRAYGAFLCTIEKFKEAESALQKAIQLDPHDAKTWAALGLLYMGMDETESINAFRRALEMEPDNPQFMVYLGETLSGSERYIEAEEIVRRSLSIDPEALFALALYARCLYALGRLREAIEYQVRVVKADDENHNRWYMLAAMQKDAGFLTRAEDALKKTISMRPDFLKAWEDLIEVQTEIGVEDELLLTLTMHEEILRAYPDSDKDDEGYLSPKVRNKNSKEG